MKACLVDQLAGIPCRSAILDAEVVLLSAGGVTDVYDMPAAMLVVFAFDLLHRDGRDLRPRTLLERRGAHQRARSSPAAGGRKAGRAAATS